MTAQHEADLPHDYESSRGEMYPTGPCAICGQSYQHHP